MFSEQTYRERRARLRAELGAGLALFMGNGEAPMNYRDNPYPFRQDGSFLYFFGMDVPGLGAVIDCDDGREIVFGDDATLDDIVWTGPQPLLAERCEAAGVGRTAARADLGELLAAARRRGRDVHFLPQYRHDNVLALCEWLAMAPAQVAGGASTRLVRAVVAQRSIKSDEEVAEIERALAVCHAMQVGAMRMTRPGMYEREVAAAMEGIALSVGSRLAFPTIFSIHGETLHNHYHGNVMEAGCMVVNDCGAESPLHYACDITRTFPVAGAFTPRQKDVYGIVLAAQDAALAAVAPGTPFRDVHLLACATLAEGLKALGLMRGDPREAVAAGAHALFFQCGLGHMLGLDVHDMEGLGEDHVGYTEAIARSPQFGLRSLRLGRELAAGFVITVEPGLYFIPALIDRWRAERRHAAFIDYDAVEAYRDFGGIRVEDDVLVTPGGCRVLGPVIPRTIDQVEAEASKQA